MSDCLALLIPAGDADPWLWLDVRDGAIGARGEGLPEAVEPGTTPVIAVAPAAAVALHWADLPDRSQAQAIAAARLLVAEASMAPLADLHVAVGAEAGLVERPIGVVANARIAEWLATLIAAGLEPAAIVPAPMLLPRPDEGYVLGDLGVGGRVVRGATSGFAHEDGLTELVVGDAPVETLDRVALERAIVAALADPPLDLRQGPFARRHRTAIDWPLVRRLAWLIVAIMSVTLLITLTRTVRYGLAADTLEAQADALARQGLPRGETVNDAARQLTDRLAKLRGAGIGFSTTAAAATSAVQSVPGAEVTTLAFDPNGDLRVGIAVQGEGQIIDIQRRIQAAGFIANPVGAFQAGGTGRITGVLTVSGR